MTKTYTTEEAAKIKGVSKRRIQAMIKQDQNPNRRITHFPNAVKKGRDWLIPEKDLNLRREQK